MDLDDKEIYRLWQAAYAVIMAYEHGSISLEDAMNAVYVIFRGSGRA